MLDCKGLIAEVKMKCFLEHTFLIRTKFLTQRMQLANRSVTFGHTTEALKGKISFWHLVAMKVVLLRKIKQIILTWTAYNRDGAIGWSTS